MGPEKTTSRTRIRGRVNLMPRPNGSRSTCGRLARRRKGRGRQSVPARAQHSASFRAITARQLQALVRQPGSQWHPAEPAAFAHHVARNGSELAGAAAGRTDTSAGVTHRCETGNSRKPPASFSTSRVNHPPIVVPSSANGFHLVWIVPREEDELSARPQGNAADPVRPAWEDVM